MSDENSPRNRVHSTPVNHGRSLSTTGHGLSPFQLAPAPPRRPHSRTRSISAYAPPSPSPLSSSFPASATANEPLVSFPTTPEPPITPSTSTHRHTRIHSRNISVFFPRPGSLPHSTITEDQAFEAQAPVTDIPSAGSSVNWRSRRQASSLKHQPPTSPLGAGFTFGGRPRRTAEDGGDENGRILPTPPPMVAPSLSSPSSSTSSSTVSSRRGHHHKHSLSHNFFAFLEPGGGQDFVGSSDAAEGEDLVGGGGVVVERRSELHTQPTPVPVSPWTTTGQTIPSPTSSPVDTDSSRPTLLFNDERRVVKDGASIVGVAQFVIGAALWVVGQQVGSLACTGLGYWVVFDAVGVGIGRVFPRWLAKQGDKKDKKIRRPYGNARVETVLMFAQAVYLMFSSVYVCKETVEHVLLSTGSNGGEKHHHHYHPSDDDGAVPGIEFPLFLLFITFFSLTSTAFLYQNHAKLVNVTNTRIPSFSYLIRSLFTTTQRSYQEPPPTTQTGLVLSNPYVASPLFFCLSILFVALCIPQSQHEATDLLLAALIAIITFNVAYRACTVLGTVLLQTAPRRGLAGGKMEAFLRAMKELQKHPQVLHLPPPHIWQLAAPSKGPEKRALDNAESLIVAIELRVRSDLGDEDVLRLTRWAWEKCTFALGANVTWEEKGKGEGPEVTVGVVRG